MFFAIHWHESALGVHVSPIFHLYTENAQQALTDAAFLNICSLPVLVQTESESFPFQSAMPLVPDQLERVTQRGAC